MLYTGIDIAQLISQFDIIPNIYNLASSYSHQIKAWVYSY